MSQYIPFSNERFRRSHMYIGWLQQMHNFLLVKRDWEKDKIHITESINYLQQFGDSIHVNIYPEGRVFSKEVKKAYEKRVQDNNCLHYTHLLHPKTKGFIHTLQTLRKQFPVDIYDYTVGYTGKYKLLAYTGPVGAIQLPIGQIPDQFHYHIKHYPSSLLPTDDYKLSQWLTERWKEKDNLLDQFYRNKSFPGPYLKETWHTKLSMLAVLTVWMALCIAVVYAIVKVPLLMMILMGGSAIVHYTIDRVFGGWDKLTVKRWRCEILYN